MAQTVIGFFDDQSEAQRAVEKLQSAGFSRDRVDVSRGSSSGVGNSYESGARNSNEREEENGVTRFFKNLFGSDDNDDADRYSTVAGSSNSIVTVHAQSREEAERAAEILDDCGAVDVDERAASVGYTRSQGTEDVTQRANLSGERDATIERVEENLEVGKRTEERGGVRLRSRIVERPVEEHVRLREEHINVERQPVNRTLTPGDAEAFREQTIELTEKAEVPVVNKEARVVEEIRVSKDVSERDETIRDNVRHTEIDVDRLDDDITRRTATDYDPDLDHRDRSGRGSSL
jgi:stress response protein YsnF